MLTLIATFIVGFIVGVLVTRNNIKKVNLLVEEAKELAAKAEEELAEAIELEDETEEVPDNFVDQMASRIGIILQREMDPTVGATEVTKYIYETTYPNKVNYFCFT